VMIGFDTGFFVELLRGNNKAIEVWEKLIEGEDDGVVSCLSLFELERLGLKGAIGEVETLLESIPAVCRIMWLDFDNLSLAARLSHGIGIPSMDSLILAGLVSGDARSIYTTDSHLEQYSRKGIMIINIKPGYNE